ncbi:malate dehydrogenase [Erysipelothrix rhusiopathiae SY1027]|nr:malate dehydrogenase [Erysipelothrix rhusiopathiae SY1027]
MSQLKDSSLELHRKLQGKIEVNIKKTCNITRGP